jgi:hypothetical protein
MLSALLCGALGEHTGPNEFPYRGAIYGQGSGDAALRDVVLVTFHALLAKITETVRPLEHPCARHPSALFGPCHLPGSRPASSTAQATCASLEKGGQQRLAGILPRTNFLPGHNFPTGSGLCSHDGGTPLLVGSRCADYHENHRSTDEPIWLVCQVSIVMYVLTVDPATPIEEDK